MMGVQGLTTVYGTPHPDVRPIAIARPRDVRTIRPTARAPAFAAVYDGEFTSGELRVVARLADGTVHREEPPLGLWTERRGRAAAGG